MKRLNKNLSKIILISILICLNATTYAFKLTGRITDEKNQPIPYVLIYISGTSNGTTANSEGLYSLDLLNGTHEISFRMIGYSLFSKNVIINNANVLLDVTLKDESVKLQEVTIRADAEDPAYEIIRKAQKKRKFYRDQVDLYSANAYVKSTQRLVSYPKKIFGQEVNVQEFLDTTTKIFYLSESVSELFFKSPDKYKEKMISSKVSGNPQTYSFNQSTDVLLTFYDNLVTIGGLTPRGIVSPIAGNSIFYYKFRYEGTFSENGILINKIAVTPKRTSDPAFTGTIYIAEDSWRIYSVDLLITKAQQMEIVDTFHVKQNFIKVNEETWMPFSHQFDYSFNFMGFRGDGVVLGVFSNYNLTPQLPPNFFGAEIMKVDESANKKDSTYWENVRPVPLTNLEVTDYHRKDSSRIVHESKEYLDSIDRKANKFKFTSILSGYSWKDSYRNKYVTVVMPLQRTFFNTVEGWNSSIEILYEKEFGKEDRREYSLKPTIRYGFSNKHFNGHVEYRYRYNTKKLATFEADAGTTVEQINPANPISELINTVYSIVAEKNYMKLYEKQFIKASHRSELFNGFVLRVGGEYAHRMSLENTSNYKTFENKNRAYLSNDPVHPNTDTLRFPDHNALIAEVGLAIRPGQKYIDRPEGKYNVGSVFPVFRINYKKGINGLGSDVDYDVLQAGIDDNMRLGLIGRLHYMVIYGDFLSKKKLFLPDLKHFNGNKTWFTDFRINDFKNLDYYTYSTSGPFLEVHAEQNFGGFFLNKIPLIRKLKLQEIAGVHYLHTNAIDQYVELSIGFEKLNLLRVELFTSLMNGKKGSIGFLFGLKRTFGR